MSKNTDIDTERLLRIYRESHLSCEGDLRCNKCRMTDEYLSSRESKEPAALQPSTAKLGASFMFDHMVNIPAPNMPAPNETTGPLEEGLEQGAVAIAAAPDESNESAVGQDGQGSAAPPSQEGHAAGSAPPAPMHSLGIGDLSEHRHVPPAPTVLEEPPQLHPHDGENYLLWVTYARTLRSLLAQREERIKGLEEELKQWRDAYPDSR